MRCSTVLLLLAGALAAQACLRSQPTDDPAKTVDNSNKDNANTDNSNNDNPNNDAGDSDVFQEKTGTDASKTEPYDNSAYEDAKNAGTTVSDGDELSCDFDSGPCCWGNTEDADTHDWRTSSQKPNEKIFADNFNSLPPSTTHLVTANLDQNPDSKAIFVSCQISCAKPDTKVLLTLDHYRTGSSKLEVCKRAAGSDALVDCQAVPANEAPGPTLVELPSGENFELAIVASNMVAADGDIVMIDDIVVTFDQCDDDNDDGDESGSTDDSAADGDGSGGAACGALQCDFQGSTCDYKAGKVPGASDDEPSEFEAVDGRFGPASTGPRGKPNDFYGAARVPPGKSAAMVADTDAPEDLVLRFRYWESTNGMKAVACADADCSFETDLDVASEDFAWREGSLLVPKGTKSVTLGALNEGTNQGAVGFSKVQLLKASASGNAEEASTSAC